MKYFAFSDAHGDYDALMKAVNEYGYQPENAEHTLISCGDNFGRSETGKGSKGIYEYLTSSIHTNKPVCLMGNHELILKDILFRRNISLNDIFNGEDKTVYSFLDKNTDTDEITAYDIDILSRGELMDWILDRPYYFETKNHIFVHGFLPFDYENLKFLVDGFSAIEKKYWDRACWGKTPSMIIKFAQDYPHGLDKTIVFGHWHNAQLREQFEIKIDAKTLNSIWRNEKLRLCGLDCCTFISHKIEMLLVED